MREKKRNAVNEKPWRQDSVTAEEAWEQSKIKFIINMNEKGYTIEQIADVTEKSREEVEAVLEKRNNVRRL